MQELSREKQFHFRDGTAAKDLEELKAKIESISYDEFYRHVNNEKNDFANWIEHVLRRKDLSDRIRAVSSIVETVELLNEELAPDIGKDGAENLQERIEEEIFSEPSARAKEEVPEITIELPEELGSIVEEPRLPSSEEVQFGGRMPGVPVTTSAQAHSSIRELDDRHAARKSEDQMKFVIKQFVYGFLFGVVIGFILGKIISL